MRNFTICRLLFIEYCSCDQITENETGVECDTHGRDEKCIHPRSWISERKITFGDVGVGWRIILRCIILKRLDSSGSDKVQWRVLVNAVINLRSSERCVSRVTVGLSGRTLLHRVGCGRVLMFQICIYVVLRNMEGVHALS
jgi:hypothetical protein